MDARYAARKSKKNATGVKALPQPIVRRGDPGTIATVSFTLGMFGKLERHLFEAQELRRSGDRSVRSPPSRPSTPCCSPPSPRNRGRGAAGSSISRRSVVSSRWAPQWARNSAVTRRARCSQSQVSAGAPPVSARKIKRSRLRSPSLSSQPTNSRSAGAFQLLACSSRDRGHRPAKRSPRHKRQAARRQVVGIAGARIRVALAAPARTGSYALRAIEPCRACASRISAVGDTDTSRPCSIQVYSSRAQPGELRHLPSRRRPGVRPPPGAAISPTEAGVTRSRCVRMKSPSPAPPGAADCVSSMVKVIPG